MTIGKNILNRRKKDSPSDRKLAIDFNGSIQFMHEMVGGETEFSLEELNLPTGSGSFSNPTPETIRGINLASVRERIKLCNGEGKNLPHGLEWDVLGTKIIFKNITAGVGEIFFGEIRNIPRQNISFLDGRQHQTTKFLLAGEKQINLGFAVPIADIDTSNDRLGPVEVFRQREPQYLNTEFKLPVTTEDGDYSFVGDGFGESSVIEFNDVGAILPGGLLELISVKRNQISVDKEDGSLRQEMDVLGGAVDRLAEEMSIVQSIPKSNLLEFSPTRQQLNQFGDVILKLLKLEHYTEQVAIIQDTFAKGVNAGTAPTNAFFTRQLNTLRGEGSFVGFPIDGTSGQGGTNTQFSLPAGDYEITGMSATLNTINNNARLFNVTDSIVQLAGAAMANSAGIQTPSMIAGKFTLSGTKIFILEHFAQNPQATFGKGDANQNNADGSEEWYSYLMIRKITKQTFREALGL